jgi:hypothetical protein
MPLNFLSCIVNAVYILGKGLDEHNQSSEQNTEKKQNIYRPSLASHSSYEDLKQ